MFGLVTPVRGYYGGEEGWKEEWEGVDYLARGGRVSARPGNFAPTKYWRKEPSKCLLQPT